MPALNQPTTAQQILYLLEDAKTEIINKSLKKDQSIYTVQPLNYDKSFEGALTFSEGGNTVGHVDGGFIIMDEEPGMHPYTPFSYVVTHHPRAVMAILLSRLFYDWNMPFNYITPHDVSIGENTSIGHSGFGWVRAKDRWVRFPHVAGVRIGPHTTIGANCSIPRGALSDTIIGRDTHLDDQVHIGHGSKVGDRVIIAANAMLSGSVTVEDDVWIGPSASIMQGVRIGARATIGIGAVVLRDVLPGETVVGHHKVIPTRDKQLGVTR